MSKFYPDDVEFEETLVFCRELVALVEKLQNTSAWASNADRLRRAGDFATQLLARASVDNQILTISQKQRQAAQRWLETCRRLWSELTDTPADENTLPPSFKPRVGW